jgi:two-component sensor histidine kinase
MDEIKEILKVVLEEKKLNEQRFRDFQITFTERLDKLYGFFVQEQALNASRHAELKSDVTDIRLKMVTKDEFEKAFSSLSWDITALSEDYYLFKKKISRRPSKH